MTSSAAKPSPGHGIKPQVAPGHGVEAEVERMLAVGREIRSHMKEPVSSDLSDLYDGDGFPLEADSRTDIEPALKA